MNDEQDVSYLVLPLRIWSTGGDENLEISAKESIRTNDIASEYKKRIRFETNNLRSLPVARCRARRKLKSEITRCGFHVFIGKRPSRLFFELIVLLQATRQQSGLC